MNHIGYNSGKRELQFSLEAPSTDNGLYSYQRELVNKLRNGFPLIVQGGRRIGLSFVSHYYAVDRAVMENDIQVFFIGNMQDTSTSDFIPFVDYFMEKRNMVVDRTRNNIQFNNGSKIQIVKRVMSLRGTRVDRKAIYCIDNAHIDNREMHDFRDSIFARTCNPNSNLFVTCSGSPTTHQSFMSLFWEVGEFMGKELTFQKIPWDRVYGEQYDEFKNHVLKTHGHKFWNVECELN